MDVRRGAQLLPGGGKRGPGMGPPLSRIRQLADRLRRPVAPALAARRRAGDDIRRKVGFAAIWRDAADVRRRPVADGLAASQLSASGNGAFRALDRHKQLYRQGPFPRTRTLFRSTASIRSASRTRWRTPAAISNRTPTAAGAENPFARPTWKWGPSAFSMPSWRSFGRKSGPEAGRGQEGFTRPARSILSA